MHNMHLTFTDFLKKVINSIEMTYTVNKICNRWMKHQLQPEFQRNCLIYENVVQQLQIRDFCIEYSLL